MSDDEQNPYAPPSPVFDEPPRRRGPAPRDASDSGRAWFSGGHIVLPRYGGEMPDRCVMCNQATDFKLLRNVQWHPPWISLLMCAGWLPYLIAASLTRKRSTIHVGLCYEHERRRKNGLLILWMAVGFFGLLFFVAMMSNGPGLMMLALLVLLIGVAVGGIQSRVVRVNRIDDQFVYLIASDVFMHSLPTSPEEADEPRPAPRKKKKKKPARRPALAASEASESNESDSTSGETDSTSREGSAGSEEAESKTEEPEPT
ncbi:MAG: hypothetical protein U0441_00690 [Polyangiaceae bacterium]